MNRNAVAAFNTSVATGVTEKCAKYANGISVLIFAWFAWFAAESDGGFLPKATSACGNFSEAKRVPEWRDR